MLQTEEVSPKSLKRRLWPRFTLRVLLALITLLCVGVAFWTERARQQRRVVEEVRRSEGGIVYDFEYESLRLSGGKSPPPPSPVPPWLLNLLGPDFFHQVRHAYVTDPTVTPDIHKLRGLEDLVIYAESTSDKDLAPLSKLKRLKTLSVSNVIRSTEPTQVTDKSLVLLSQLPALQFIDVRGYSFSAIGLKALASSPSLVSVRVTGCAENVVAADVDAFRRAGRVKELWVSRRTADGSLEKVVFWESNDH
jgi:hypothetical protein